MRTLKLILLAVLLIVIVLLAVANRGVVQLNLMPEGLAGVLQASVRMPMFLVILLSILAGMAIGYLFEWLREHKHRRRATEKAREAEQMRRDRDRLREQTGRADDDVLALLN